MPTLRPLAIRFCSVTVLACGCATRMPGKALPSIQHVRQRDTSELTSTVEDSRRALSGIWSDIRHDWNYADEEQFGDLRNAAGH